MLLNQVTGANLRDLNLEVGTKNREFFKKMLARTKNENPLFVVLASVLADNASAQRKSEGPNTPEDVHMLVLDTAMLLLRALELATIAGTTKSDAQKLMEDPAMDTLEIPLLGAIVETRLILGALGVRNINPPSKE